MMPTLTSHTEMMKTVGISPEQVSQVYQRSALGYSLLAKVWLPTPVVRFRMTDGRHKMTVLRDVSSA